MRLEGFPAREGAAGGRRRAAQSPNAWQMP
jgi:hypothetical protein